MRPHFERLPLDVAIFARGGGGANDWIAVLVQRGPHGAFSGARPYHGSTKKIGVDDEQHTWWYLGPLASLSSVRPAFSRHGRGAAMAWLIDHPGDRDAVLQEATRRFAPERVVVRASTAGGACADPMTAGMIRWAWQAMQRGRTGAGLQSRHTVFGSLGRTLDRKFSQHLGMGAGDYLRSQRLDMAVHLLRSTNLNDRGNLAALRLQPSKIRSRRVYVSSLANPYGISPGGRGSSNDGGNSEGEGESP